MWKLRIPWKSANKNIDILKSPLKNQFMLDPALTYLNHGSFGACPKLIFDNLKDWQIRMEKDPVQFLESDIFPLLADSRKALGNFLGCEGDDLVYYPRSEEHTSELKSQAYLVCRLLLEKKKLIKKYSNSMIPRS